jgi:hypothetical protein
MQQGPGHGCIHVPCQDVVVRMWLHTRVLSGCSGQDVVGRMWLHSRALSGCSGQDVAALMCAVRM